jgi:co-chaperonin GroES (HSP10)
MSVYDKTIIYKGVELPKPVGCSILIEVSDKYLDEGGETKSEGGIIISQKAAQQERYGSCVGTVVALGEDTYNDVFNRARGCKEPWCQAGDLVMLASHSGRIIPNEAGAEFTHGRFQMVNDEQIIAVYGAKKRGEKK